MLLLSASKQTKPHIQACVQSKDLPRFSSSQLHVGVGGAVCRRVELCVTINTQNTVGKNTEGVGGSDRVKPDHLNSKLHHNVMVY